MVIVEIGQRQRSKKHASLYETNNRGRELNTSGLSFKKSSPEQEYESRKEVLSGWSKELVKSFVMAQLGSGRDAGHEIVI